MASEEQKYHATRFKLEIELGNDTMQTRSDVARALETASRFRSRP